MIAFAGLKKAVKAAAASKNSLKHARKDTAYEFGQPASDGTPQQGSVVRGTPSPPPRASQLTNAAAAVIPRATELAPTEGERVGVHVSRGTCW